MDPFHSSVAASLDAPLRTPITRWVDGGVPRLFAGGMPVTPVNLALRARLEQGATYASIRSYDYAASIFLKFVASRALSLMSVSDADFGAFTSALTGRGYSNAAGEFVNLPGRRTAVTANNIIGRLYGLFEDIEEQYGIKFDWRRYRDVAQRRRSEHGAFGGGRALVAKTHRHRTMTREPRGLPDEQFAKGLLRAYDLWGNEIPAGDGAYAPDRASQTGSLLWRNLAILFLLRFAGARRAEVSPLDLTDIDRRMEEVLLVTKGRQGARERIVFVPTLANAINRYLFEFRPYVTAPTRNADQPPSIDRQAVFLSHSVQNYGRRISDETVRLVVEALRPALDPPWRTEFSPHSLRHQFAYDLQRLVGPVAASAAMRHRSGRSLDAYRAAASQWAPELTAMTERTAEVLRDCGVRAV